ncbi:hypothetical protein ACFXKD_19795 [Nocardiopsis aegyptia]|uniref:hypothetical protein n=1 Tax=Nocardiopsis aegyptia TaxID=220378 RepID=UPI00367285C5
MPSGPDFDRLRRLRAVTAEFRDYQGLNLVPPGLLLMSLGLLHGRGVEPLFAAIPVAAATALSVRWYYRRRFGVVEALAGRPRIPAHLLLLALLCLGALFAAALVPPGPVGTGGLVFAAAIALCAYPHWRLRVHHLVVGAVLAAASLLPLGLWTPTGEHPLGFTSMVVLTVVGGAAVCVAGLFDHRVLVRTLPAVGPVGGS